MIMNSWHSNARHLPLAHPRRAAAARRGPRAEPISTVLGAPVPEISSDDTQTVRVMSISSDKQQLSPNIAWPKPRSPAPRALPPQLSRY